MNASEKHAVCDLCAGSGWVTPDGTTAVACRCQKETKRQQRIVSGRIPRRYLHCTLANFHDRGNISLSRARKRATEFADCWPTADRGLLMMGGCGVGKTHLAVAILQEIIQSGKPGKLIFNNFQDLIQEVQASFGSDDVPSKSELLKPLLDADLLVLDELGSQKPTTFVQDVLYYIVNTRYNDEKPTLFTSNYFDDVRREADERLEDRIGERLRSRLYEMTERITFDSDDYRKNVAGRRV